MLDFKTLNRQQELDLKNLRQILQANSYQKIRVIPCWQNWIGFPFFDIINVSQILKGDNILFNVSALPVFYFLLFGIIHPKTYQLFQLFFLNNLLDFEDIEDIIPSAPLKHLVDHQILDVEEGQLDSSVRITPFKDLYFISSRLDQQRNRNYVYLCTESFSLAEDILKEVKSLPKFNRCLDLCTGTGIIAITLSPYAKEIIGTDVNPLALHYAKLNSGLNDAGNVNFIYSDLFDKISGQFDIITANPPILYLPSIYENMYSYSDDYGMKFSLAILEQADSLLTERGLLKISASSPVIGRKDLLKERITEMFHQKNFTVKLEQLFYFRHIELLDFMEQNEISYFIFYLVTVKRSNSFKIETKNLPLPSRLWTTLFWKLQNFLKSVLKKK